MRVFLLLLMFCGVLTMRGQYAPAAGKPGTTAIGADSSVFLAWASSAEIRRGWINISDTTKGKASYGNAQAVTGKADNNTVSLGDGGVAVVSFKGSIFNGPGWDFAVFENSFDGKFLELAFVEVSSNGSDFYRFPAHSLTQDSLQTGPFGTTNPEKINNLAGKYKAGFGTPFDLDEMKGVAGLDVDNIVKIRIVDVVGSIDTLYATYDTAGNKINDPWPVNFPSSGFDLDAVGIIHFTAGIDAPPEMKISVFPNPATEYLNIKTPKDASGVRIEIYDVAGKAVFSETVKPPLKKINISSWPSGLYIIKVSAGGKLPVLKKIIIAG